MEIVMLEGGPCHGLKIFSTYFFRNLNRFVVWTSPGPGGKPTYIVAKPQDVLPPIKETTSLYFPNGAYDCDIDPQELFREMATRVVKQHRRDMIGAN